MFEYININNKSTPKYQQIINCILDAIKENKLELNSKIPSLNYMVNEFKLSQDTVLKAYNHLKSLGIVASQVGKGYYISKTNFEQEHKIFVLFDNYTAYKEDLFNTMVDTLGKHGELDLFFHHNKPSVFKSLIDNANGLYTSYIIMPILNDELDQYIIDALPVKSVYILDRISPKLKSKYPCVCQNFEQDILDAFKKNSDKILKYNHIRFIGAINRTHVQYINKGLESFAYEHKSEYSTETYNSEFKIEKGDLIVCLNDRDLVQILLWAQNNNLQFGFDIGLISYNETDLKKVIGSGITTISTDFRLMGESIISLILKKERKRIFNKSTLILRNSI